MRGKIQERERERKYIKKENQSQKRLKRRNWRNEKTERQKKRREKKSRMDMFNLFDQFSIKSSIFKENVLHMLKKTYFEEKNC